MKLAVSGFKEAGKKIEWPGHKEGGGKGPAVVETGFF